MPNHDACRFHRTAIPRGGDVLAQRDSRDLLRGLFLPGDFAQGPDSAAPQQPDATAGGKGGDNDDPEEHLVCRGLG